MSPDELKALLTTLGQAADVVEAIDDPAFQSLQGWNLKVWSYVLIPWGVRFTHIDLREEIDVRTEVVPERRGKSREGES